ncbi:NADH:flavin oxidoreductase/NADH oxidase [Nakamurella leprariae]|nr:NADH:flavin oxidoreductase/NADH oxidase [Nakamurella leprariae]
MTLRNTEIRNRVWVAPMCQYSAVDGRLTDWHLVHLGGLARGGAGLVITEATAVTPEGRISPWDAGIWTDEHAQDWRRITDFLHGQGALAGIQLAHAGRKASTAQPWRGGGLLGPDEGGWVPVGPSPVAFEGLAVPKELSVAEIAELTRAFAGAARRAVGVGFDVLELHAAHGYLLHQFLSPVSNTRSDGYGGDLSGRSRLLVEVVDAVRAEVGEDVPLLVRVSATDWVPEGLQVDEVVEVAKMLAGHGVDLIDVSSGGNAAHQRITVGPGYQVPFARAIKEGSGLPVAAVGMITEPHQAEQILVDGAADAVLLARVLLREPSWPQRAAHALGGQVHWAPQYERAAPR